MVEPDYELKRDDFDNIADYQARLATGFKWTREQEMFVAIYMREMEVRNQEIDFQLLQLLFLRKFGILRTDRAFTQRYQEIQGRK